MAELWLFQRLTLEEKQHLQTMTRRQIYGIGAMLFQEGESATAVFLITAGRIRLYKSVDLLTNQRQVSSEQVQRPQL